MDLAPGPLDAVRRDGTSDSRQVEACRRAAGVAPAACRPHVKVLRAGRQVLPVSFETLCRVHRGPALGSLLLMQRPTPALRKGRTALINLMAPL